MEMKKKCLIIASVSLAILIACICVATIGTNRIYEIQMERGYFFLDQGNYEEAILAFELALKIDPKCDRAYIAMSEVYAERCDKNIVVDIKKCLELGYDQHYNDENIIMAYINLSQILYEKNQKKAATELLESGINITKDERIEEQRLKLCDKTTVEEKINEDKNNLNLVDSEQSSEIVAPAASKISVIDALNYKKEVVTSLEFLEMGWSPDSFKGIYHEIRLPKITSETENARLFNQKLYDTYGFAYNALIDNTEEHYIYGCDYEYKIYNGIIAITIEIRDGIQGGGGEWNYKTFYYDTKKDCEITFEEYLTLIGLSKELVWVKLQEDSTYLDFYVNGYGSSYSDIYVLDCLADKDGTIIYLNTLGSAFDFSRIDVGNILPEKDFYSLKKAYSGMSHEKALTYFYNDIKNVLIEYLIYQTDVTDKHKYFFENGIKSEYEEERSFLADINNDNIPELCVLLNRYNEWKLFLFEFANNVVELSDISLDYGGVGPSSWRASLYLFPNGEITILYNNGSYGAMSGREEYSIETLGDGTQNEKLFSMETIEYTRSSDYIDGQWCETNKYYIYENDEYIEISNEKYKEIWEQYMKFEEDNQKYVLPLIVDEYKIGFDEVWNKQKNAKKG